MKENDHTFHQDFAKLNSNDFIENMNNDINQVYYIYSEKFKFVFKTSKYETNYLAGEMIYPYEGLPFEYYTENFNFFCESSAKLFFHLFITHYFLFQFLDHTYDVIPQTTDHFWCEPKNEQEKKIF